MQTIKTLADLNRYNRNRARVATNKLRMLLANGEIAIRTAENIRLATISGSFGSSHSPSLLSLAEDAERQIGAEKGTFARRNNAKHSRRGVYRIGPEVKLPENAPIAPYRLQRSLSGFYREHARKNPRGPLKTAWTTLENAIAAIADGGVVKRFKLRSRNGEALLRTERYSFKLCERSYEISLGQFEKYFTESRKPLEMVR
jgi:hypothetical protein